MDIVLGVSTAPSMVHMVLVEGENADGATVEEDTFEVTAGEEAPSSAAEQVASAIVGTRESAAEAGYRLASIGVTWTDPSEAAGLRDALATHDVGSAMLVSPLLAAAALAQTVGAAMDYAYTALIFVERESATLAVVDSADGSIVNLQRRLVHGADAVTELIGMVTGMNAQEPRADGVFVVGCGVDIVSIKSALESATTLPVNAPEEPDMALAHGAALASANAPLFASATAALAYARDPGTGEVNPYPLAPAYLDVAASPDVGTGALAYSAVPEEGDQRRPRFGRFILSGSALATLFVIGAVALVVSLAADVRPTVGQRPGPGGNVVIPTTQVPPQAAPPPVAPPPPAPSPPIAPPPAAPAPPAAPPPPPEQAMPTAPPPQGIAGPAPVQLPPSAVPEEPIHRAPPKRAPTYVPPPVEQAPAPALPVAPPPPVASPPPAAPPPPPVASPPPAAPPPPALPPPPPPPALPPPPRLPPMTMYLHLPFVTVPIPINPPPPPGQ
ncbi:hypothetical protein MSM1_08475 [Mycobacterium sp. SM1]|uniref:DUF7159 family protein n=1 Tax=Mycobacterium sp. SM1 TaxID=2816243 RepID=UPI001BCB25EC|nr:hypothetical protein [Mycobacterium sp. SM1]MBS4728373.1 hypothetical protein [Mycobacterium sp. SM1]